MKSAQEIATAVNEWEGVTSRVIDVVQRSSRRQELPLEASLSLPTPLYRDERIHLAFFWASQGGPPKARVFSAPYGRTLVELVSPFDVTFESLADGALGVTKDGPPLLATIGRGVAAPERKAFLDLFHSMTDRALTIYVGHCQVLQKVDIDILTQYRRAFERLAVIALRPAYHALSPRFFEWLESVTLRVVEPMVGDVYACKNADASFSVVKVLAVDVWGEHVRLYRDRFTSPPQQITTAALTASSGHIPVEHGWLQNQEALLLAREPLREEERAGYELWRGDSGEKGVPINA